MEAWPRPARSILRLRGSVVADSLQDFALSQHEAAAPESRSQGRSKRAAALPCRTSRNTR